MATSFNARSLACSVSLLALIAPAGAYAQAADTAIPGAQATATGASQDPAQVSEAAAGEQSSEIIVTARRREETLLEVPVTVGVVSSEELDRYSTDTLDQLAEIVPGVQVGRTKSSAGGTIGIRGISTTATTVGFQQPVLISIDGVPVSNGRAVEIGFFDLQRVEVLKGPQALLFGKNNTVGVISLVSANPTSSFQATASGTYEFVADEIVGEAAISGPVTDTLGARFALQARHMKGWMYNTSRPIPNPFRPAFPLDDPARYGLDRYGERGISGRLTLDFRPTPELNVNLKAMYSHQTDDGFGGGNQAIGCPGGPTVSVIRGRVDPFGECFRDNRTQEGRNHPVILANGPDPEGSHGELDALTTSLNISYDVGSLKLTSQTGYLRWRTEMAGSGEFSSFAQLYGSEPQLLKSFSQEFRMFSDFDSRFNFMAGVFYEDQDFNYEQNVKLFDDINFNPATGLFIAWLRPGYTYGKTYSAFGQLIWDITDEIELAGGARYTREKKNSFSINEYAFLPGFPQGKSLSARLDEDNISPEVTLAWRPNRDTNIYAAYRTGFKSGGFALSGTIQTRTTAADLDFGSEKARGFEVGAKFAALDRRLRLEASAYRYKFTDLQVNVYNPVTVSYTFDNASSLTQRGIDLQALFRPTRYFELRGAVTYSRNRYGQYAGACYGLQTPALGCNLPGPAQDLTGRPPARSPDWTGNAGATLELPLGMGARLVASGDAFYSDSYFGSETLAPLTFQQSFWRFNAALRLVSDNDKWEIGLVGRNLSNEYFLLTAQDRSNSPGHQRGTVSRGREIALTATVRY